MKKYVIFAFFAFILPSTALAQTPAITAFNASPSSGASGYLFALTWTLENSAGASLIISCDDGVKITNYNTGSNITCNSKIKSTAVPSGSLAIKAINISGFSKTIPVKLIPKDSSDLEYAAQTKTVYITVSPSPDPIASFASSVSNIGSGGSITLSWDIPDALGANISIGCVTGVKATSTNYIGDVPCGKQIFNTALSKTSSLVLSFTNSSASSAAVDITLFPKIGATAYNGVNTETITISVAAGYFQDPIVYFFKTSAASAVISSGEPFPVSWATEYAKGVNLKISCASGVTAVSSKNSAFSLPCADYAFSPLLAAAGDLTLIFQNKNLSRQTVVLSLIPSFQNKDGYDATKTKTISVEIKPAANAAIPVPTAILTPTSLPLPTKSAAPSPSPTPKAATSPRPAKPETAFSPAGAGGQSSSATTTEESAFSHPKDIQSTLERLFDAPKDRDVVREAIENNGKKGQITKTLLESKKLDEIESFFLNPQDATYDVSGRRSGRLMFLIPVKVKINLVVDENGKVRKTEKPWWSFLVRFN